LYGITVFAENSLFIIILIFNAFFILLYLNPATMAINCFLSFFVDLLLRGGGGAVGHDSRVYEGFAT